MQYRELGKTGWQVSALGFGAACLPPGEAEAVKMLRYAIDSGVNYVDIGWPLALDNNDYLSRVLREGLTGGYRDKVKIAAAIPAVKIKSASDFDRSMGDLLTWLGGGIDFLLFGGLNRFTWPALQETDSLRRAETAIASRKISRLGFFFHDQYQFLRDILDDYDGWSLAGFQYSFMDIDHHPGVSGLQLAASTGLGVVVTRPLLGGRLVSNIPRSVASIWEEAGSPRSPLEWALRWVWNHPEVSTVVCDMSTRAQVRENAAIAADALPDSFSVPEELVISRARDAYRALKPIPCTACRGCMPCPQEIDVPRIFEIYNDALMYGDTAAARSFYRLERHNLDSCTECASCSIACGKNIPITDWLEKARALLAADK
jgi:predicted aldo/keto reductase-like oxidoreductase